MSISLNSTYFGVSSDSVSTLFGSLSTSASASTTSMLSDYASIKNGSYARLLKSYYAEDTKSDSSSTTNKTDDTENKTSLTSVKDASKALRSAASKLWENSDDSVFNKVSVTNEDGTKSTAVDMDAVYKQVSSFVDSYNDTIAAGIKSTNSSVGNQTSSITSLTKVMSNSLSKIGITVGTDNKLTIDESKFKKSDISNVKSLFSGTGSYAYQISSSASQMANTSVSQLAQLNGSIYTSSGSYSDLLTGSLYSSLY